MIYDSDKRMNPAIEEIINAFQYKDLIAHLIRRDITTRYKRSVLGIIWTMLNPLGVMIIMTLVFQDFFHRQQFFPVYLLSGLLAFNFFNQTSTAIIKNLIWGEDLFQRIYIPRASFAIAAVGTSLVNLVLAFVPLILVKIAIGSPLSWHILFVPIYILCLASFSLGVGLIVASMALYFHDIAEMYQVILTGWFYATPVIYPYDTLSQSARNILAVNPMLYIVNLMRDAFYSDAITIQHVLILAAAISSVALIVGWLLFSRQTEEFVLRG
jgi:ABC-type polysaccharide/polyol phosphate export permease